MIIKKQVTLNLPISEAFDMFVNETHLENWLSQKANVIPVEGGAYELFWSPNTPDDNSTIGCKIMAIEEPYFLTFDWKGPVQFKQFMNDADPLTYVTIIFTAKETETLVSLIHSGWRNTTEWIEAKNYFEKAWLSAFKKLENYVS